MNTAEILSAYSELASKNAKLFAPMESVWLRIETQRHFREPAREALRAAIESFEFTDGWVCFTGKVEAYASFASLPRDMTMLSAELRRGQTESLHVRQDGQGGWLLTRMTETSHSPGQQLLASDQQFISTRKELGPLRYRVYWRYDDGQGYRKYVARFVGFGRQA